MSLFNVVFRMLNKAADAFVEPRTEDGHGSAIATPSYAQVADGSNALTLLNAVPSESVYGLPTRTVGGVGRPSAQNATTTPLNAGLTYIGNWEQNNYTDVMVTCITDQPGTLFVDLSPDGVNVDSTVPYSVDGGIQDTHRLSKGARYFRVRFTNTSASNQTYLRLNCYFGQFSLLNLALNGTIAQDADAIVVRNVDSEIDISAGRFQGYSIVNKFGTNTDVDSNGVPADIWDWQPGTVKTYTGFPTSTLETISVFSSSTDDASGGNGARTVRLTGLGDNYDVLQETVTLNGTTPVATLGQFRRLHTATVLTTGPNGGNAGIITFRHTTTTTNIFLNIAVGRNQSNASAYTVPAGFTGYMRALHVSIRGTSSPATQKAVEGQIWTRAFGQPFRSRRPFIVTSNYRLYDQIYGGIQFTEKSDIILRITAASDMDMSVNGGYDLILVRNI